MDMPDIVDRLADYARILRRRADTSQREMAALAKVSIATISGLESERVTDVRLRTFARPAHLDPRMWRQPSYWTPPHGILTFDRDRAMRDLRRQREHS